VIGYRDTKQVHLDHQDDFLHLLLA